MYKKATTLVLAVGVAADVFASSSETESARIGEVFNFGMLHLEWPTALFILVVFSVTAFMLNTLLFKPILRTLEARESEVEKNRNQSGNLSKTLVTTEQDYQAKLSDVRTKIQESRQQSIEDASKTARETIEAAKNAIAQKLENAEKELAEERSNALAEAASLTGELAQLIRAKVLA